MIDRRLLLLQLDSVQRSVSEGVKAKGERVRTMDIWLSSSSFAKDASSRCRSSCYIICEMVRPTPTSTCD